MGSGGPRAQPWGLSHSKATPAGSESVLPSIATAAQASMLPYFPTIMAHLREFLLTSHEDLQPVRIQSLGE